MNEDTVKAFRQMGEGEFSNEGEEPHYEELIEKIILSLRAQGFSVTPVEESKANAVIRAFHGKPSIPVGDAEMRYCGVKLYIEDTESGNFTTYDGSDHGDPWCRNEHAVWCQHPQTEKGLYFKADFMDRFLLIEKDEAA